jgi:glycosyltransferase involved in cell wall biosynthesis
MAGRIAPTFPEARFMVIGDGSLRQRLELQADKLGIGEQVNFAGWRSDVPQLMAAMDVFVMPSLFEGGPTTVLEAMAMGKPVVATRVGMVPEVVDDGRTGLVVDPGNARALADAVSLLLADDELRTSLGKRAREHAVHHFSIDLMVERYLAVFARAYGARRRRA